MNNPCIIFRLYRFYRSSGTSIIPALKRAIHTARIGF